MRDDRRALLQGAVWLAGWAALVSLGSAIAVVGAAAVTGSWGWSLAGGALALTVLSWGVAARSRRRSRRFRRTPLDGPVIRPVLLAGCSALASLTWLWPGGTGATPQEATPPSAGLDVDWISRPDGTALAVHVTRAVTATRPPLIVVHGGPGVADMAHDVPAFATLATDRDVYVYDQAGTGASTRLADPADYTTARAVDDLEAVREWAGADEIVLLAHSWGARVATVYLSEHPERVAALVLSAPDAIPARGETWVPGDLTARLDGGDRAGLYLRLFEPRNLFAYALTAVDPVVAHDAAGDHEMDRRFMDVYRLSAPALFCDADLADRVGVSGVGYYANQTPQLHADPTANPVATGALRRLTLPVLLIKPACDYMPWSVVSGYMDALPQTQLVVMPDAGHAAYLERPDAFSDLVLDFLGGRELPLPTQEGTDAPDAYRGVR